MMSKACRKDYLNLLGLMILVCGIIFLPYLLTDHFFLIGYDMRTQTLPFFEEMRNMVHQWQTTGFSFWTWNELLGNDFYTTKLFYFIDWLDIVFAFTSLRVSTVIVLQSLIRFMTAGLTMMLYAHGSGYRGKTAIIGSLSFAFSAYMLSQTTINWFVGFTCLLPLFFWAVDRYMIENKRVPFVIMVALLFLKNYYMFYSVSLLLIIYFVWRWHTLHDSWKGFWKAAFIMIAHYVFGLLLVSFAVVPQVLNILNNDRVGARSALWLYPSIKPYILFITGIWTPMSALASVGGYYGSLFEYVTTDNAVMQGYLWTGTLNGLILIQLLSSKNTDRVQKILFAIIALLGLIPLGSSIMHGFSEPSFRWLNTISFFLVAWCMPYIEERPLELSMLKKTVIAWILWLLVSVIVLASIDQISLSIVWASYYRILILILLVVLVSYAYLYKGGKWLLQAIVIELCTVSYLSFYGSSIYREYTSTWAEHLLQPLDKEGLTMNYLNELSEENYQSFYRVYVDEADVYANWGLNLNLVSGVRGLMTYDSTMNRSTYDILYLSEDAEDFLPWAYNITDPDLMNVLSVKYAIVSDQENVPFANYELVGSYKGFDVYENLDYFGAGKTYTKILNYDDDLDDINYDEYLVVYADDQEPIKPLLGETESYITNAQALNDYFYAEIDSDDGFVVLSVPYHDGWTVMVNGQVVESYRVQGGLTGFAVPEGHNVIEMSFRPVGLGLGIRMSLIGLLCFGVLLVLPRIRKKA